MVDDLDVVPIGIEDEGAVVPRVVAPLARRAVVAVTGCGELAVEGVDRGVVVRLERDVEVLRRRAVDQAERRIRAAEVHALVEHAPQ